MSVIDKKGKLFGKLNIIDLLAILLIVAVLALIGEPLTMKEYPRRDEWLRGVRERVYRELAVKR